MDRECEQNSLEQIGTFRELCQPTQRDPAENNSGGYSGFRERLWDKFSRNIILSDTATLYYIGLPF